MVEGPKLIEEALRAGARIEAVYLDRHGAGEAHVQLARRCHHAGAAVIEVQPGVLARASDTVTPQPIAALVEMAEVPMSGVPPARPGPVLVCAGLQDPGNAGSIVRVAAGSGAGAVIFCASVDPYNPKAVRGSAGALFRIPVVIANSTPAVLADLGRQGRRRLATVARGGDDYLTIDLAAPVALVFGSEAAGLPRGVEASLDIDGLISIPMSEETESLNVASAAAVLCFEAARQRRSGQPPTQPRQRAPLHRVASR